MNEQQNVLRTYEIAFGPFVHMSQQEKSIWLRWLQSGGVKFAPFKYDIRVGDGLQMPEGSSTYAVKAAAALTTKRIDAMYESNGKVIIVEVKVRAGASAVGQLITYRDLLQKTPGWDKPIVMLLVTDSLQPDTATVLESVGILWNIVKP